VTRKQRPGAIYAAYVRRTGVWAWLFRRPALGYVGKTRQWVKARWRQHEASQPWADTVVEWRVIREWKDISGIALWWAEVWRIVLWLPLYNIQYNRLNPRRIRPWTAQRQARRRGRYVSRVPMAYRRGWRRRKAG
jgi:hypothetical protein